MLKRKKSLVRRSSMKRSGMQRLASEADINAPSSKADAAETLWSLLREREVAGLRFRRQQAVGPFVADFVCPSAKLILKIERLRSTNDAELQWFRDNGYRVLQFLEREVLADPQYALDAIARTFEFRLIPRNR